MAGSKLPEMAFRTTVEMERWLRRNHASSSGIWLRIAKKGSGEASVTYAAAVESALCYGWIDGQKRRLDDYAWLQKFTPRGPRSIWSRINRERAEELIGNGRMAAAGRHAVEKARADGRWDAAYDSQSTVEVPEDFQAALDKDRKAARFFAKLNSANRYAILFRLQTAKNQVTREKRIASFVEMLRKRKTFH
jgi:uncharacterized protein YdeI (YjbR/CyaY-like superfamily)